MPVRTLNETGDEIATVHAYAFEVSVNDPEPVEITSARHDPRELRVIKNVDDWI